MYKKALTHENYARRYGSHKKRVYAPQLSEEASLVVRYIAATTHKPMTNCLNQLVAFALSKLDIAAICGNCKESQLCSIKS